MDSELTRCDLYFKILDLKSNKNYKVEALYDFVQCNVNQVKEESSDYQSELRKNCKSLSMNLINDGKIAIE